MDVKFINPFVDATLNVLRTMAGLNPTNGKPYLKAEKKSKGEVTGLIGLVGAKTRGSFAVSFQESCIKQIVSNMLGEEIPEMNGDVLDAVGELTNMISGGARAKLAEQGLDFEMAVPMVITGTGHNITHITDHPIIVIPFETEAGSFFIEACLK
ncbi:MAG: chemotaxis protein CheX [Deltaproteobacteria bacterium]|nr:chemotaxis protein CheX [Deltaproteobacteria bacterium]MBW2308207.1 chemotaxis protein CheX [Deltaproteobacteria bacterium]